MGPKRHLSLFHTITRDATNSIAYGIIDTTMDYFNFLLYSATEKSLDALQHLLNKLERVFNNVRLRDHHVVDPLHDLYWLPVWSRITIKVQVYATLH